jgi:hypothetical protein
MYFRNGSSKTRMNLGSRQTRLVVLFTVIGICLFGISCSNDVTVWRAEVPSPDDSLIASAQTDQGGGPGTAHLDTLVYLRQNFSSARLVMVLAFDCETSQVARPGVLDNVANAGGSIDLTMKWVTPRHLEVTYDKHPDLYFQAVKALGAEISVRDISDAAASPTR